MEHIQPQLRRPFLFRFIRFLRRQWLFVALVLLALWSFGFYALGVYTTYANHPELDQANQAGEVLTKVSKLINLPQGETPQMAAINNAPSAKQSQPFLKDAENGDVLIVYAQVGEAILYRPSTNKLIAVGPVKTQPTTTDTETVTPPTSAATMTNATSTKK